MHATAEAEDCGAVRVSLFPSFPLLPFSISLRRFSAMATYRDPYSRPYSGQAQAYPSGDNAAYNPYDNRAPHETYDQGGYGAYAGNYRDEPFQPPDQYPGNTKEESRFDDDTPGTEPKRRLTKTSRTLRTLKYDNDNLWTRSRAGEDDALAGSAAALYSQRSSSSLASFCHFCFGFGHLALKCLASAHRAPGASVNNPNYFSVAFKEIKAQIFYPINNTPIGTGQENNIVFPGGSSRNITFPFTISYKSSSDPNQAVISDIASKCGFGGGSKSNLVVNAKLTLGLKVLAVTISPTISQDFSFACPLSESDIENGGLSGLSGLLSGSS
ncbi:hypothetical protein OE88DRAFT_998042 [Heliocybe sulcata]|uniref:Late embryogenesis abundant protein LEA-2 subgroup domain-containing protein n=1 Tax=Heliocybe sulcata TaxID=5364 RepID=A0A5C3NDZ0_9AGAM|nr:hypothetical protein OE88DRAFT_998042 [Heliocybe sulcata]